MLWLPHPARQRASRSRIIANDFWLCKNMFAGSFSPSSCYVTNQACWETLLSWRSLPDPKVFVTHSRPKQSGNLNRCFCETVKMFLSSRAEKNSEMKLRLAAAETSLSEMEVIKNQFWRVFVEFSTVQRLAPLSHNKKVDDSELWNPWKLNVYVGQLHGKVWLNPRMENSFIYSISVDISFSFDHLWLTGFTFICELTWVLT